VISCQLAGTGRHSAVGLMACARGAARLHPVAARAHALRLGWAATLCKPMSISFYRLRKELKNNGDD
jgi:hypothetical protein